MDPVDLRAQVATLRAEKKACRVEEHKKEKEKRGDECQGFWGIFGKIGDVLGISEYARHLNSQK